MSNTTPTRDPEEREITTIHQLGRLEGRRVLEIGCGEGRMTWRYATLPEAITGIDPDLGALTEALSAWPDALVNQMAFAQAKAEHLPFPKESFETAVFSWSL